MKEDLDSLVGPQTIKTGFSDDCKRFERIFKNGLEDLVEECGGKIS